MNRISLKNIFLPMFLTAGMWLWVQTTDMVSDDITHGNFLVSATDSIDVYGKQDAFSPVIYHIPAHKLFYAAPLQNSPWYVVYVPLDKWNRHHSSGIRYVKAYILTDKFERIDKTKQTDNIPLKLIFITGRKTNRDLDSTQHYYGYFHGRDTSDYIRQMYVEYRGHRMRQPEDLYKDLLNLSYNGSFSTQSPLYY